MRKVPPTLKLYYADTYGYLDFYKDELIMWVTNELIPMKLEDAEKSLKEYWKDWCKANSMKLTECPALKKGDKN